MLFNSFSFLVFFIIVAVSYFLIPHKFRWILLLIASYYFYMCWRAELIILIVFSTFVNYRISLAIYHYRKSKKKKKALLQLSLFINFGLLFFFKYLVFFNHSLESLFSFAPIRYPIQELDIILPMGISFYTFQAAAYTIDVYRQKIKPVRHYGIFSLFISFFPQLVAGPIERSQNLLPQFYQKHSFDFKRVVMGLKIMLYGFFKKIVIADRAAVAVNTIFNQVEGQKGLSFLVAAILFSFQLYCDFSGYSDIAVGSAKVLGFDIMANFRNPYFSKSIREFWRRWHISLSTWFMDYVYIPLGGSRCAPWKHYRNLFLTFLVSGLWHGANWTFVLWGALHGIFQVVGLLTQKARKQLQKFFRLDTSPITAMVSTIITFMLVFLAFIFFRANTVSDAFYILTHLLKDSSMWWRRQYVYTVATSFGLNFTEIIIIIVSIITLFLPEFFAKTKLVYEYLEEKNFIIRLFYYCMIGGLILAAGVYYNAGEFIYFQF